VILILILLGWTGRWVSGDARLGHFAVVIHAFVCIFIMIAVPPFRFSIGITTGSQVMFG